MANEVSLDSQPREVREVREASIRMLSPTTVMVIILILSKLPLSV